MSVQTQALGMSEQGKCQARWGLLSCSFLHSAPGAWQFSLLMLHTQGTRAWVSGVEINVHESWERRDIGTGELAGWVGSGRKDGAFLGSVPPGGAAG